MKERVEKILKEWAEIKREYALPNSTIAISDIWTNSYDMALLIKDLWQENQKLKEPDYFYNLDDWEVTYHEMDMLYDELQCNNIEILGVGRLARLPDKYLVKLYNEDTEEEEIEECDSYEEAEKKLNDFKAKQALESKE